MKKALKRSLSLILAITIIFSSAYTGLGEVDFSESFGIKASAAGGVESKINQILSVYPTGSFFTASGNAYYADTGSDCCLSNIPARGGLTSGADAALVMGDAYSCCAFARYVFYNIFKTSSWSEVSLSNARLGDYVVFSGHYGIYLSHDSNYIYVYDSNWQTPHANKVKYSTAIARSNLSKIYRASNYDEINASIDFWSISNTDGTDAGIDKNSTFTISGKYKFWFKKYDSDTNYYINVFLDNTQLLDHASSDDNGYVSVEIDAATITPGLHTLTANLVNTSGTYSVSKQFYSEIKDNQDPVISEVKLALMAENGYLVTAKVSDNVGVDRVYFPTWIPGQSQAEWLQGTYNSSTGLWECWVDVTNWDGYYGTYYTDVYAYDAANNEASTSEIREKIRVPKLNGDSNALASSGTYDLSKTSTIYAKGWIYNRNGDNVKIHYCIDNGSRVAFDLVDRTDVTGTYADCKQVKCGYSKNISIANLSSGQHTIEIIAETNGMTKVVYSNTFTVVRPESYVYFDMNDGSSKNINLLAPQKATKTTGGITYSFDGATGIITLNGTASGNIDLFSKPFKVSSGEVYKITSTVVSGSVSNGCLVLEAYDNDGNRMNFDTVNTSKTGTWTITSTQAQKINRISCWAWCDTSKGNVSFNNYKIKFKLEKVASSSASATGFTPNAKYLAYGQTYDTMPAPTRTGYSFDGWYTAKSGGTKITASSVFSSGSAQTLYAHWTANKYPVTFNANGGTGAPSAQTKTHGTALALSSTIPTRTGYTFKNWNTKADGTGTSYSAGGSYTANEVVTLYAQWTANTYIVTFNANGGTCSTQTKSVTYNGNYGTLPIPTRDGYAFVGWYTEATNGTKISDTTKYTIAGNQTLYAQWTANIYTVTFNANGGTCSTQTKSVTYDETYGTLPTPTRENYTFNGWFNASSGGTQITDTTQYTTVGNQTLYAQWTINKYTVTFDANGGTNAPEEQMQNIGEELQLSTDIPTRTGYTFVEWNTKADGSGESYASGDIYIADEDVTLYAQWKANSYLVSFNANGGNCSVAAMFVEYDATYGTLPTPTRTGYTFVGWYTAKTGGTKITNTTTYTIADNQTLYAQWTANKYTVTFDANGGTCSTITKSVYYDSIYGTLPIPTRTGYTFVGWYTAKTGGTKITHITTYTIAGNQTLYAQWEINKYTIKFDANGGEEAPELQTKIYDNPLTLSSTIPTRTGYDFMGWNTKPDGTGDSYGPGGVYEADVAVTLYAQWEIKKHTVSYNANFGSGAPTTQIKIYDIPLALSVDIPTRTNYIFIGWNTKSDGTGENYASGASYIENADVTLYAQWKGVPYTVTFNPGDGTCETVSKTVEYGSTYGELPIPEFENHKFVGWYTSSGSIGDKVTEDTIVELTKDLNLFARWEVSSYTIKFYGDYNNKPSDQNVPCGEPFNLTSQVPEKVGYIFSHWVDYDDNVYYPGQEYVFDDDVTYSYNDIKYGHIYMWARWNVAQYTITFDARGGYCDTRSKLVGYTEAYGTLPVPTRQGYIFKGWYTNSTGGTKVEETTIHNNSWDSTLYAVWEIDESATITGISVLQKPAKTEYYIGESLDTNGMEIEITYADGSTETVTSGYAVSGFDSETIGAKTVIVLYEGFTDSFIVSVVPDNHTHNLSDWIIDKKATCTENGSKHQECTECGEILDTVVILSTGHNYSDGCCTFCGEEQMFEYTIENDSVTITKYVGTLTEIVIPSKIGGLPVTSIGSSAFSGCSSLKAVTIPEDITSIGSKAFYGCTYLEKINWNAKSVADFKSSSNVFYNVGRYGAGVELVFGDSVKNIPAYLCYISSSTYAPRLKSVTIGENTTSIGKYAFYNCTSLTSIITGNNVTSIGSYAFGVCTGLTSIVIPDSVTSIDYYAFYCCTGLLSITIPDSVTYMGDRAFESCKNLESVIISGDDTNIGNYAFNNCLKLKSVEFVEGLAGIGDYSFKGCTSLTSIKFCESVTSIGSAAFYDCTSLNSIYIPDTVTNIGASAFYNAPTTIYCLKDSTAHNYAMANDIDYVLVNIFDTENARIDYENRVIHTNIQNCNDVTELLSVSESSSINTTASFTSGTYKFYGTGSKVTVLDDEGKSTEYTLIVDGDINGDSVVDVLDSLQIALASSGKKTLDGAYAMAADSNADDIIDISDYQDVVNKAVS